MKRNFSQFSFFTMTSPFPRLPVACGTARQSPSGIALPTLGTSTGRGLSLPTEGLSLRRTQLQPMRVGGRPRRGSRVA